MKAIRAKKRPEYDVDPSVPCYKYIGKKGFFTAEDELLEFGTVFYMDPEIEPNEDLEPMNQLAHDLMNKFFDKLDASAALKAEKDGKSFAKRPRNFSGEFDMPTEESRKVQLVKDGAGVPLMGAKKRGRPRINKVVKDEVPQTTREAFGNPASVLPE